jgi:hypothetical protein
MPPPLGLPMLGLSSVAGTPGGVSFLLSILRYVYSIKRISNYASSIFNILSPSCAFMSWRLSGSVSSFIILHFLALRVPLCHCATVVPFLPSFNIPCSIVRFLPPLCFFVPLCLSGPSPSSSKILFNPINPGSLLHLPRSCNAHNIRACRREQSSAFQFADMHGDGT